MNPSRDHNDRLGVHAVPLQHRHGSWRS